MTDLKLAIKLTTEGGQVVVKDIQAVSGAAEQADKKFVDWGKTTKLLTAGLAALGAGGLLHGIIKEHELLERNLLRTNAMIKATGGAAGFSAEQLHKQARELALATLQSTEGVMHAQQVLLSYSTVTGDQFQRAIELSADLATLIGGNLNGSLEMLAKALDDPIQGINAMRRQGIYFTESQKAVIAQFVRTNDLASAQSLILDSLAGQFGGLARGEAQELSGAKDTLNQAIQEANIAMAEQLGLGKTLASVYNGIASGVFAFTDALEAGDLDGYLVVLKAVTVSVAALTTAKYAGAAATWLWTNRMLAATAASTAFGKQGAMTAQSFLTIRTAAYAAAAAFVGWEVGTWLRDEFEIAEKAGIALAGGIHRSIVWLGGQFDVFAAHAKHALTNPLDFARDMYLDFLKWLSSNLGKALEAVGVSNPFTELSGQLEQFRSESGQAHKEDVDRIKAETVKALATVDDEYAALFASVTEQSERAAKKIAETPLVPNVDEPAGAIDVYNKALLDLYNNYKLNATAVNGLGAALEGVELELFKANFQEALVLPKDAAAAIREFAVASEAAKKTFEASAMLTQLQQENELLQVRLDKGLQEYEIQMALAQLKGANPAVLAQIEAELRARQMLNDQIKLSESHADGAFNKMLDGMTALNDAGTEMGDILVQQFGRVAQQVNRMSSAQAKYNEQLAELKKEREKILKLEADSPERAKKLLDIQRTEARLASENTQAQLGQFAALTGAAKQFFGEQSREREALHKIEMAFSIAEMAMATQKAAKNALVAITKQGEGDPYTAWGRIAAMMALMGALGVFSGSGGGGNANMAADRQKAQGTGTALGDSGAQSKSIANALGRIEDLELDQYRELRAINDNLRALAGGISQLAVSLVQRAGKFDGANYQGFLGTVSNSDTGGFHEKLGKNLGGPVGEFHGEFFDKVWGSFSKTTKKLLDSGLSIASQDLGDILATGLVDASFYNVIETTKKKLWGLTKKKSTETEFTEIDAALATELGRIYEHLYGSIQGSLDMLGLSAAQELAGFDISLPNISFKDLTGDEIEQQLQAAFSAQADQMVQFVAPSIAKYQQMGEGLFDTLVRVAQEQAVFNGQLDAMGMSLKNAGDITAEAQIAVAQSVIELMGGIDKYREMTGAYYDAFFSPAEKFARLNADLGATYADLNLQVPDTQAAFRDLVGGIDLTSDSGAQLFATLMRLVPAMEQYYDALEQRAQFEADIARELGRMDMSPFEQQLDELQAWYSEQIQIAEDLGADTVFLEKLYARKRADALSAALADITAEQDQALAQLKSQYDQLFKSMDSAGTGIANAILSIKRQMGGWDEVGYQNSLITDLTGQLGQGSAADQVGVIQQLQQATVARFNAELAASKKVADAAQQRYQQELASVQALRQAAQQLKQAADALLLSDISPALMGAQLQEAQRQFAALTGAARAGDATAAGQLQGVGSSYLNIAKDFYSQGSAEYAAIFNAVESTFRSIGANAPAEPPVPAVIRNYQARDAQLQAKAVAELEALQGLLDSLREQEQGNFDLAQLELTDAFALQTEQLLAAADAQVAATKDGAASVAAAIAAHDKSDAMISALQRRAEAAEQQNKVLVSEIQRMRNELTRSQELLLNSRRAV